MFQKLKVVFKNLKYNNFIIIIIIINIFKIFIKFFFLKFNYFFYLFLKIYYIFIKYYVISCIIIYYFQ